MVVEIFGAAAVGVIVGGCLDFGFWGRGTDEVFILRLSLGAGFAIIRKYF